MSGTLSLKHGVQKGSVMGKEARNSQDGQEEKGDGRQDGPDEG